MRGTKKRARRAARKGVVVAVAVIGVVLGACDDDPTNPDPANAWEATLAGQGTHAEVAGEAAVLSNSVAFAAEIALEDAPADAVFEWAVVEGTCAEPGDVVGEASAYPELEVAANGTAAAEADDDVSLDVDEDYAVVVTDESGAASVLVACGALERI